MSHLTEALLPDAALGGIMSACFPATDAAA
jgi:hypothetical protein